MTSIMYDFSLVESPSVCSLVSVTFVFAIGINGQSARKTNHLPGPIDECKQGCGDDAL